MRIGTQQQSRYGFKRFPASSEARIRDARSVGQRLAY